METAWVDWPKVSCHSAALKADYIRQFEHVLKKECLSLAPQVPFWPSSPSSGGSFDAPNSYDHGDVHCWDVWHGLKPFEEYRLKYPRFCSEFGFESYPCRKTVDTFALPEDHNAFSRVMDSHQKCRAGNAKILYYMAEYLQYPRSFDMVLYASQLLQAEAVRAGVEHWRRNRGRCMGAIYWQLNDCWPVASWASIDSEGRWKALHYAAKRFYAPVLVSCHRTDWQLRVSVANDTLDEFRGTLLWRAVDALGNTLASHAQEAVVPALSAAWVREDDLRERLDPSKLHPEDHLAVIVTLKDEAGAVVSDNCELFSPPKFFAFNSPDISWEISQAGADCEIILSSSAFAWGVFLDVRGADCLFSDNNFFLLPGEQRRITAYSIRKETLESGLFACSVWDVGNAVKHG
jgi:beta-mannosidase